MLDAMRQPLESGEVIIARANHRIQYPARLQLVAAMNPCRCGGRPGETCRRGAKCAEEYQSRISGPLLDRVDLHVEMPAVSAADLVLPPPVEGSDAVRARVTAARAIQRARYQKLGARHVYINAHAAGHLLEEIAMPEGDGLSLLKHAAEALQLSARGFHRTLRVARTLADLEGVERVERLHIAEALSYRGETLKRLSAA